MCLLDRFDRAEDVGGVRHANESCAWSQQLGELFQRQITSLLVSFPEPDLCAEALELQPATDVGLVIDAGDDDLVPG